jgi:glycosyltransferase involved in cell wall biosynthesis
MSFPLVSIVTPSYNQAEYLEDTIRSVLAQEYPNLEYLIVDGGSTDGSLEIIQKYADQLAWWVSEPDDGQADAINKGLRRARGKVVAWLNSDDLYLPGAILKAVSMMQENSGLAMVYGDAVTIDPYGRPINRLAFGDWKLGDLMRFRIICQPAVFMRRTALEQAGYLDEDFHFMLDHHLWLRVANVGRMKYIPNLWAAARHHPEAKNVAQSTAFAHETYRTLRWMETDPDFALRFSADRRHILGGANRLAGRYFLDGGLPAQALKAYSKALLYWPSYAIQHWHRIAYAIASLISFGYLDGWLHRLIQRRPPDLEDPRFRNWPGILLA